MSAKAKASDNRARMPGTAREVDAFRAKFGSGVRVLHAKEGEQEVGTRPDHGRTMNADQWLHYIKTGERP
jgi:hypothetical protein